MYADIATALTGIKTIADFVTLAAKSKTDAAVAQKALELSAIIFDLNSAISIVQAQNYDLLRRNHELEQKIMETENWNATAEQYALTEVALGVFVYANKKNQDTVEPTHWLCTKCYEDKKKSIIQREETVQSGRAYVCMNCNHRLYFSPGWFGNKQP